MSDEVNQVAVKPVHTTQEAIAESDRAFRDRIEYWLSVSGRAADHAEDPARRRLLLERLGQLYVGVSKRAILFLDLGEEPHVLDGDDGLVGEGLEEGDLPVREEPLFGAPDVDCSDRNPFSHQRDVEGGAMAHAPRDFASLGKLARL